MDVIEPSFEVVADGFTLVEGPRDDGAGGFWFTDAFAGGIHHWADGEISTVAAERKGVGGLVVRAGGGVIAAGHDLSALSDDDRVEVVLPPPEGVVGFNDICAAPDGGVLAGGLRYRPFAGDDPVPGDLWHLAPDGAARLVATGIGWPNGITTTDERTALMCDYADGRVLDIDLESGHLEVRGTSPSGEADGIALDEDGGAWVALGGGGVVARLSPEGVWTHRIEVPAAFVTSLAFVQGGDSLLVTTFAAGGDTGAVLRCPSPVKGVVHATTTI